MALVFETPSQINLVDVIKGIGRWKTLLIAMPLIGLLIGVAIVLVNKPTYQSEAQVLVQSLATPFDKSASAADSSADTGVSDRLVQSQVSVMKSRDIASRVVDQLNLDTKDEYNAKLSKHSIAGWLMVILGLKDDPEAFEGKDLAIKTLTSKITIYPVPESSVIGIKSNSNNPETAAAVANAMAETYVLTTHEVGQTATDRARNWLSSQIDDLRSKVSASENEVEKYRADHGLLKGASTTVSKQQLTELNTQISATDAARAEAIARAKEVNNMLKQGGRIDASSDVLGNALVQNLRQQQVAAERNLQQLSVTYLPNHPKIIAAQKDLEAINVQVRAEALRVVQSLQSQAKIADERGGELRAQLERLKGDQATANVSDIKLQELEREAAANRSLLQNMLVRFADANARQDASQQPGYARVIQKASVASVPYFPKPGPIIMLSTLGGLIMGLGLAFFLEILSAGGSARAANHVAVRQPVVQASPDFVVPRAPVQAQRPYARGDDFEAQSFDMPSGRKRLSVRRGSQATHMLGIMPGAVTLGGTFTMLDDLKQGKAASLDAGAKTIADTLEPYQKANGHATCAIASIGSQIPNAALATLCAARELAQRGNKVIALDFSAAANNLETLLDVPQGMGLIELLSGKADFNKIVTRCPSLGIHIIRLGQPRSGDAFQALAEKVPLILEALRDVYDYIFLHVGEAGPRTAQHVTASDVVIMLAPMARMIDAKAAVEGLEDASDVRALVMRLEPGTAARKPESIPA